MIKQRFVGFLVLGALAIIFWPIVFGTAEPEDDLMLPVIEMPDRPSVTVQKSTEPVLERVDRSRLPTLPEVESADKLGDVDVAKPRGQLVAADTEPSNQMSARQRAEFDAQGLPLSWELQVATFSEISRADDTAMLLREKGYKAYVAPVIIDGRKLFRVRIGPNIQRQRLLEIQADIDAYFGVESRIVKFEV